MPHPSSAFLLLAFLGSCIVPESARPRIELGLDVASREVFRGMVQTENGVFMPETVVSLPAKEQGTIVVAVEGSADLSDDTGDAFRPDGHSGRLGQFEWTVLYLQVVEDFLLTFGLASYNLPNGREFPLGERGATTELLIEVGTEVWGGLTPSLRASYDIDEVDGLYLEVGVAKGFELAQDLTLDLDVGLGWMDEEQSFWHYAQTPRASGLADLRAVADLGYELDKHTTASLELGFSQIVDDDFREWFDVIGIDTTQVWVGVGMRWTY